MHRGSLRLAYLLIPLLIASCDTEPSNPVVLRTPPTIATVLESDAARPAKQGPARIVMVSLDTTRADHIFGYSDTDSTPNLRKIVENGYLFRDFYSSSTYTLPSHMSILTGLDPLEHGVVNEMAKLGSGVGTLALWLSEAGYRTQAFQEGGYVDSRFGYDRGFRAYEQRVIKQLVAESLWGILDWIRDAGDEPYFLFLQTYAPHYPYGGFRRYRAEHPELGLPADKEIEELKRLYQVGENYENWGPASRDIPSDLRHICTLYNELSYRLLDFLTCGDLNFRSYFMETPHFEEDRAALLRSYDEGIRRADRAIGRIRDALIEADQWDDTLFIVTSDHGEAFFEHGLEKHDYVPFNEVIKVPLLISWPRGLPGGQMIDGVAWHLDIVPTILSLAGVTVPKHLRGIDLAPMMRGQRAIPVERTIFPWLLRPINRAPLPTRRIAIRGGLKYIEGHEAYGDPEGLLFDLVASPDESENLRTKRPDAVAQLTDALNTWIQSLIPGTPVHQVTGKLISPIPGEVASPFDMPEERRRELQALGYL